VKAAGIPGGVNGTVKAAGIPGGVNGPNEKLGIVGAVCIVGAANVPVTPGIAGALGIRIADVELLMPGIGGGLAVKVAVNRFVKSCKLLVSSTPPRREEEVAGFC
jgi:hypothetical protein